jgi:hypothetical protein
MNKIIHYILLFTALSGIYCDRISNPDPSKKVKFGLYTGFRDSTSLIAVSFESYDTLNEKPTITIGASLPDTIESKEGFYRATFKNLHPDSIICYKIKIYNDSVNDQLKVPGEIDSVFCNNQFIFGNYKDSTTYIDTASTYLFYWKALNKSDYFSIEYYGDLNNDRDGSKYYTTKDTFFTITPEIKGLSHSFLKVLIENCQGNPNQLGPNVSSSKIELYYVIRPTRYTCHIYMLAKN